MGMKRNQGWNADAVSEIVGAILLISMTVLAASVVGIFIFSQPQAESVDRAEILISANTTMVLFQNTGGDALGEADLALYYDGVNVAFDSSSSWPFEPGDTITYTPGSPPPTTGLSDHVAIVFTGISSEGVLLDVLVEEGQVDRSSWAVTVPGPIPTSSGEVAPPTPAEAGEIVWNYTNSDSSHFWKLGSFNDIIVDDTWFNFTVLEDDNWIMYDAEERVLLSTNDEVSIMTDSCNYMSYYGVGTTGIQFTFDQVVLYVNDISIGGANKFGPIDVRILGSKISKYGSLSSTLTIDTGKFTVTDWVTFWQNGTLIVDEANPSTDYVFSNIRPTETGMMLIDVHDDSPERFYLVAKADVSPPV